MTALIRRPLTPPTFEENVFTLAEHYYYVEGIGQTFAEAEKRARAELEATRTPEPPQ